MILMYHKVDLVSPTTWWVTRRDFQRQLDELADREFVYLDQYSDPSRQVCITFDDAFENVLRHAVPELASRSLPFEIFVIGGKLGAWNHQDTSEPLTRFMTFEGLEAVVDAGGRLQWHTVNHPNLQELEEEQIARELSVSRRLADRFKSPHFRWFAYPYGLHDQRSMAMVRDRFDGAVAVAEGDPANPWTRLRITVDSDTYFVD